MKFVYVGDPTLVERGRRKGEVNGPAQDGKCTFVNKNVTPHQSVTFKVDEPKEAPEWLRDRLLKNSHFQVVEEGEGEAAESADQAEKPRRGRKPKGE